MGTVTVADKIAPPDSEEYSVLVDALSRAKTQLYSLRVARALEQHPAPPSAGRNYGNLLQFLQRGDARRVQGKALAAAIEAAEAQVEVLQDMFDEWQAHEDAFRATQVVDAKDPA